MTREQEPGPPEDLQAESEARRSQLRGETEVSSLPPSMFDANDPLLEAKLAESTAEILGGLAPPCRAQWVATPIEDLPLEPVAGPEIAALGQRLAGSERAPMPMLTDGAEDELFAVLVDACLTAPPAIRERAVGLLRDGLDLVPDASLDRLTSELLAVLGQIGQPGPAEPVERLCRQLAAAIAVAAGSPESTP